MGRMDNDPTQTQPRPEPPPWNAFEPPSPVPRRHLSRTLAIVLGTGSIVLALLVIGSLVRVPFFSEGPGPAHDVLPLISVEDEETFPTDGRLLFTTVSFSANRLNVFQFVDAWLDPNEDLVPEADLLSPGQTIEEENELQRYAMDQSQLDATAVALRALGRYPAADGKGALIEGTMPGCEADGELFPGNIITAIDGEPVSGARGARDLIDAVPPREPIDFTVLAGRKEIDVALERTACGHDDEELVGVSIIDPFPVDLRIDDAGVGGPSAGLMFALGIYDKLDPDDLLDGRTVAGTGQIDLAGNIYAIGGVDKKLQGAEEAGATVFLVPEDNLEEARRAGIEGVKLIPVGTFDDAVEALGGDTVNRGREEG